MIDPINTTEDDGTECQGCGEAADVAVRVVGRAYPVPLCRDCQDDLLTACASCERTIWQAEGKRTFNTASLYCRHCDDIVQDSLKKVAVLEVDQVRR